MLWECFKRQGGGGVNKMLMLCPEECGKDPGEGDRNRGHSSRNILVIGGMLRVALTEEPLPLRGKISYSSNRFTR